MASYETLTHLLAGGAGGTLGAIMTCPLEVVKTRLQSSQHLVISAPVAPATGPGSLPGAPPLTRSLHTTALRQAHALQFSNPFGKYGTPHARSSSIIDCFKHIVKEEGARALYKGLGPIIVGVAPARAIHFCSYHAMKKKLAAHNYPEGPMVHILSASCAGFMANTATNPIWVVKTLVQLDTSVNGHKLPIMDVVNKIYKAKGIKGFYSGLSASYYGISETAIHFAIYEYLKTYFHEKRQATLGTTSSNGHWLDYLAAAGISKGTASVLCYPHEVARTRLRECDARYRSFWQTLRAVVAEEGTAGLYRGLTLQLMRQIPNTAIMMTTYEVVVWFMGGDSRVK